MSRVIAAVIFVASGVFSVTAQQQVQPEDVRNDPEFSPSRIQLHMWQHDWTVKRQQFKKVAGEVVSCYSDYFHINYNEANRTRSMVQEPQDDEFFCNWQIAASKNLRDKEVVFLVVIQLD